MESVLMVLPIGQGACNLVEVYDNSNALVFLGMVDCGNKNEHFFNYSNVSDSFEYLREKMKARAQAFYGAGVNDDQIYLDLFILTHQDEDHYNKFVNMLTDLVIGDNGKFANYLDQTNYIADFNNETFSYWYSLNNCNITHVYSNNNTELFTISTSTKLDIKKEFNSYKEVYAYTITSLTGRLFVYDDKIELNRQSITIEIADINLLEQYGRQGWEYYIAFKYALNHSINNLTLTTGDKEFLIGQSSCWFHNRFNTLENIKSHIQGDNALKFVIGEFWRGGVDYTPSAEKFVGKISTITRNLVSSSTYETEYKIEDKTKVKVLCNLSKKNLDDCKVLNLNKKGKNKGINYKNASSLVTLWTIGNTKYLFPGDATVHTMMHLNTEYNKLPKDEQGTCAECVKRQSAIMTAPHHGSDHSSKGKKIVADKVKYSEMPDRYKGDWGIYRELITINPAP